MASWEKVVPFFNQSELWFVDGLAKSVGCNYPFPRAEILIEDNGERFFSQYITKTLPSLKKLKPGPVGECLCTSCTKPATVSTQQQAPLRLEMNNDTTNNTITRQIVTAPTPKMNRRNPNNHQARKPTQCAVANRFNYIQPAPNYQPPVIQYMANLIPMQYQMPLCFVPQQLPCCQNYAQWLSIRKGRPPHHPLCHNRYIQHHKLTSL